MFVNVHIKYLPYVNHVLVMVSHYSAYVHLCTADQMRAFKSKLEKLGVILAPNLCIMAKKVAET